MLILLGSALTQSLLFPKSPEEKNNQEFALCNILQAYAWGFWEVTGIANDLELISTAISGNVSAFSASRVALARFPETLSLVNYLSFYVEVLPFGASFRRNGKVFEVPLSYFVNPRNITLPRFVVEDARDDVLFRFVSNVLRGKVFGFDFCCDYEVVHGAGSRMPRVIDEEYKRADRFMFALCDNDVATPKGARGGTCKSVEKKIKSYSHRSSVEYFELNVHEVENAIPFCFVKRSIGKHPFLSFLSEIKENHPGLYKYMDLKNGISLKVGKSSYEEWKSSKSEMKAIAACLRNIGLPPSEVVENCNCEEECDCYLIKGFEDKLMSSLEKCLGDFKSNKDSIRAMELELHDYSGFWHDFVHRSSSFFIINHRHDGRA